MRFFFRSSLALLVLSMASSAFGNEGIVKVIKDIDIYSVNISMTMEQARATLTAGGYKEHYYDKNSMDFKKGKCRFRINNRTAFYGHVSEGSDKLLGVISYSCQKKYDETDMGIITATLDRLCNTKDNGIKNRKGCGPIENVPRGYIRETFTHPATHKDGYNYSVEIDLLKTNSGKIQIKVTESKTPPKGTSDIVQDTPAEVAQFPISVSDASNANRSEAKKAYKRCQKNANLSHWYNCDCFANAIITERVASGFQKTPDSIFNTVVTNTVQCRQINREVAYDECVSRRLFRKSRTKTTEEEFCGCYADKLVSLAKEPTIVKFNKHSVRTSLKGKSRGFCKAHYR